MNWRRLGGRMLGRHEPDPLRLAHAEAMLAGFGDTQPLVDLLERGDRIGSLRLFRAKTGADLREAKEALDALRRKRRGSAGDGRQRITSGGAWEERAGYTRALRVGRMVFVSGTTAADPQGVTTGGPYEQAQRCFDIIETALREAGATMADVVRTRMFVADIAHFEEFIRAHGDRFGAIRPASTLVQAGLMRPAMLIEVEADAVIGGGP